MEGQSQALVGGRTVSEILKSAVENAEKVLVSREDKLKEEIEGNQKKNEQLQRKLQFLVSEKLRLEKECVEFKELSCRLREERDELGDRLKEKEDDQREIIELKRKICELECEKLRYKTDLDINDTRFKDLEFRVLSLEKRDFEKGNASVKNLTAAETNSGKTEAVLQTNTNPSDGSSYGERTEATVEIVESDDDMGFSLFEEWR